MERKQLMLWTTEVRKAGDGSAVLVAHKPVVEGSVYEARKALGGIKTVTAKDVYRLIADGFITGWKVRPGRERSDGRKGNTKWILDMTSVYAHRQRMQKAANAGSIRDLFEFQNCEAV